MKPPHPKSALDNAASKLRSIVLESEDGVLLGNEQDLVEKLGVSRPTVRQVARLLEREGLLRVRRGINGGYFAAKPNLRTIENSVSSYLEMVHAKLEETTNIASILWIEVMRKAASLRTKEARQLATRFYAKVDALPADALFDELLLVEMECRDEIFKLIDSRYIEFIFRLNVAYSKHHFPTRPGDLDGTPEHLEFVQAWRRAKLHELDAIAHGDAVLGTMAARQTRNALHRRIWGHDAT